MKYLFTDINNAQSTQLAVQMHGNTRMHTHTHTHKKKIYKP